MAIGGSIRMPLEIINPGVLYDEDLFNERHICTVLSRLLHLS